MSWLCVCPRWSLIAGRLPGRTDNEIKNYWNSHLSKKIKSQRKQDRGFEKDFMVEKATVISSDQEQGHKVVGNSNKTVFVENHDEGPLTLEWVSKFLEMDENWSTFTD